jgi:hypothetical protein
MRPGVLGPIVSLNPTYQTGVIMDAAGGSENARKALAELSYQWPDRAAATAAPTTWRLFRYLLLYGAVGLLFALRAKANFRRNVF